MYFKKPRPRPPSGTAASTALTEAERAGLAERALYIGSPYHTDIPKYGMQPARRRGGDVSIERAEDLELRNPTCVVCPRKWASRQTAATKLLKDAVRLGNFIPSRNGDLPKRVWARDPDDAGQVYEAKRLPHPIGGYKAYPLTAEQAKYDVPVAVL